MQDTKGNPITITRFTSVGMSNLPLSYSPESPRIENQNLVPISQEELRDIVRDMMKDLPAGEIYTEWVERKFRKTGYRANENEFYDFLFWEIWSNPYVQNLDSKEDAQKIFAKFIFEKLEEDDLIDTEIEKQRHLNTIPQPAQPLKEEVKKKAGRPQILNPLHEKVYKEFLKLTQTNDKIMDKPTAVHRLATITFKDKFGTTIESRKRSINRIIKNRTDNN